MISILFTVVVLGGVTEVSLWKEGVLFSVQHKKIWVGTVKGSARTSLIATAKVPLGKALHAQLLSCYQIRPAVVLISSSKCVNVLLCQCDQGVPVRVSAALIASSLNK